jgi:TolA-binding protein
MILAHNIDVSMLDTIIAARLQGRPGPGPDPMSAVMQQIEQKLRPVQDFMSTIQQNRQIQEQQSQAQAEQTLEQFFADPQYEFANDVAGDMADLLEVAARRGQTLSLQDAYSRATLLHPTISKILERRRLENGAAQQTAAASRARQAAVSVSDSGAPSQSGDEDSGSDIRSALQASIRHHAGRR